MSAAQHTFRLSTGPGLVVVFRSRTFSDEGVLDGFAADFDGTDFHAAAQIGIPGWCANPSQFFRDLANHWSGWTGTTVWRDGDGDFEMAATCDRTGHVTLAFKFGDRFGSGTWNANVAVFLEAGLLDGLAYDAAQFFGAPAHTA